MIHFHDNDDDSLAKFRVNVLTSKVKPTKIRSLPPLSIAAAACDDPGVYARDFPSVRICSRRVPGQIFIMIQKVKKLTLNPDQ